MKVKKIRQILYLSIIIFIVTGGIVVRYSLIIIRTNKQIMELYKFDRKLDEVQTLFYQLVFKFEFYQTTNKPSDNFEYIRIRKILEDDLKELNPPKDDSNLIPYSIDSLKILTEHQFHLFDSLALVSISQASEEPSHQLVQNLKTNYAKISHLTDDIKAIAFDEINFVKFSTRRRASYIISTIVIGYIIGLLFLFFSSLKLQQEISNRIKKEKKLAKQAKKLDHLNKTKDTFFSIIAHDLRGPFNSLLNIFDVFNDALKENNLKMVEENIHNIEFAARRTYNLLQNLLEWGRLQTGKITPKPEYFDIQHVVIENIELFREGAKQKDIKLHYPKQSQLVYADINMINTVVRNLIQNALKFTDSGSIETSYSLIPNFLNIKFTDTGIGMSIKETKMLFRIDSDMKKIGNSPDKGSGLGLILCKNFINLNGGEIWVDSELNKGSIFYISVPLNRYMFLKNATTAYN